jgi:molecular chaperone GrpE
MNKENSKKNSADETAANEAKLKNDHDLKHEETGEENTSREKEENCEPSMEDEVIKLTKENETLKDLLQRRQADFENYKKRALRLQEEYRKTAIKEFARDIININDDLIRAIDAAGNLADSDTEEARSSFSEGVKIISKRIEETLGNYGIVEIESDGKAFDPNFHEAIEIEETDREMESDTVTKVHQKGFRLEDQVIRTAKVKVAKAVKKNGTEDAG